MDEVERQVTAAQASKVEALVEQIGAEFTKLGDLKRLNLKQRGALRKISQLIWSIPGILRGDDSQYHRTSKDADAAAWRALTFTLKHVDPLWHTRGFTGVSAAYQAIGRLVDPEVPPKINNGLAPNLRALVLAYFGEDERNPENTDKYFRYLGARDIYKE